MTGAQHLFATFDVTRQVFFTSRLSVGIVNLKPLLPGHVLLLPRRVVPRLSDLEADEVSDLFLSVQAVGRVLERAYDGKALTISLQDGVSAGQSVPHVHVHLIPRLPTDYGGANDRIYPALEENEAKLKSTLSTSTSPSTSTSTAEEGTGWRVPKDEDRRARSLDEMQAEADWLRSLFAPRQAVAPA